MSDRRLPSITYIWPGNDTALAAFELNLYKKLWSFFPADDSYYFIINHHTATLEFVSKEVENVVGYLPSECDLQLLNGRVHPDDRAWFLVIGNAIRDFFLRLPFEKLMKYKVRYEVRFRKKKWRLCLDALPGNIA
jgi:hypothetical protein